MKLRIQEETYTFATRNEPPVEMVTVDWYADDVLVGCIGPIPVDAWLPMLDRLDRPWPWGIDRGQCMSCGTRQHLGESDCAFTLASVTG